LWASFSLVLVAMTSGCGNKFWDPAQVGRFRPVPAVNVILDTLGVAEEGPEALERAEDPLPSDTVVMESDYVFRSGDVVRVSIYELLAEGVQFTNEYVVTETGKISIPEVGVVEAAGLTETQLEEEIRQILSPSILKEPSVVVTLAASQQRTFSILGDGVPMPGRYVIPRYDFRLADALATAGGQRQFNVSYVYVSRYEKDSGSVPELIGPGLDLELIEPGGVVPGPEDGGSGEALEVISPRAQKLSARNVVLASSEMGTFRETGTRRFAPDKRYVSANDTGSLLPSAGGAGEGFGSTALSAGAVSGSTTAVEEQPTAGDASGIGTSLWDEKEGEPVSVNDILKTLEERSRRGSSASATGVQPRPGGAMKVSVGGEPAAPTDPSAVAPAAPAGAAAGEPDDLDAIIRSIEERSRQKGAPRPTVRTPGVREPGQAEPAGINEILRTIESKSSPATAEQQDDWDEVLKSFAEPTEGREQPDESMDLEELLKSFAEPGVEDKGGEQTGAEDVDLGIDLGMDTRLDVGTEPVEPGMELQVPEAEVGTGQEPGRIEWVFQDGKWVPMQVGAPVVPKPVIKVEPMEEVGELPGEEPPVTDLGWTGPKTRLIKIPTDKLVSGDPRYNIVIKPGDTIYVPVDVIGEFCVMGNVNRQGYIPITGRPLTLKMAIAAAGGLGPLAWPKRVEVVRRIGRKKEEIVMVDLDKIASGEQPDFFIKPNDLINVGTHATSRWRAVLRNAFRATYGFGFVYDRNFALDNYYKSYGRTQRLDFSESIKLF